MVEWRNYISFFLPGQLPEAADVASPNIPRTTTDLESILNDVSPNSIAWKNALITTTSRRQIWSKNFHHQFTIGRLQGIIS